MDDKYLLQQGSHISREAWEFLDKLLPLENINIPEEMKERAKEVMSAA